MNEEKEMQNQHPENQSVSQPAPLPAEGQDLKKVLDVEVLDI